MDLPTAQTIAHSGKTYRISTLGIKLLLEHAAWLRKTYMDEAKTQLVGLPLDVAERAYNAAKAHADKLRIGTKEYDDAALSTPSFAYGLWLSARQDDKTITLDTVYEMFDALPNEAREAGAVALGFFLKQTKAEEPATVNP